MSRNESWVFSLEALERFVASRIDPPSEPDFERAAVHLEDGRVVQLHYSLGDNDGSPLVGIIAIDDLGVANEELRDAAIQRLAWLARDAQRGGVKCPTSWSPYHKEDLVTFFIADRAKNVTAARLIVRIERRDNGCNVWALERTVTGEEKQLSEFRADLARQQRLRTLESSLRRSWLDHRQTAIDQLQRRVKAGPPPSFARDIHQLAPPSKKETLWTLDGAMAALTSEQRRVVESDEQRPTFVQGVAGSGKSMCLALRAIQEALREADPHRRVLVLTHSWQVSFSIDELIGLLLVDDSEAAQRIEVTPLLALAQDSLMRRSGEGSPALLGSDSDEGKELQLERIDDAIQRVRREKWVALEEGLSERLHGRFQRSTDSTVRRALAWDLMIEFSDVLGANRILPGYRALEKYTRLPRTIWMLPETDEDCGIILEVYATYIAALQKDKLLSSDQAISDYLGVLSSFDWDARRAEYGYDFIAVDEYHLFGRQERLCIEYLTRNRDSYPAVLYAKDETQSPSARYLGADAAAVKSRRRAAESPLDHAVHELHQVHRFGVDTLKLVQHVLRTHPAIETDYEIRIDPSTLESNVDVKGGTCSLQLYRTEDDVRHALRSVVPKGGGRTAILIADSSRAHEYLDITSEDRKLRAIRTPDDIQSLSYSPRAVLVASASEVAGLQFDDVVIVGIRDIQDLSAGQKIALTNQLYLAITRSRGTVRFLASEEMAIPEVLDSAIKTGLVEKVAT